mmetsp:Transcript_30950/g.81373  ORF Transcript_30950/g.81373 Transcript_30950/m.81373 type:complete len:271 (-) Transcript_30950:54-866(-)
MATQGRSALASACTAYRFASAGPTTAHQSHHHVRRPLPHCHTHTCRPLPRCRTHVGMPLPHGHTHVGMPLPAGQTLVGMPPSRGHTPAHMPLPHGHNHVHTPLPHGHMPLLPSDKRDPARTPGHTRKRRSRRACLRHQAEEEAWRRPCKGAPSRAAVAKLLLVVQPQRGGSGQGGSSPPWNSVARQLLVRTLSADPTMVPGGCAHPLPLLQQRGHGHRCGERKGAAAGAARPWWTGRSHLMVRPPDAVLLPWQRKLLQSQRQPARLRLRP